MSLTALIIDDEPLARQELQFLLERAGGVEVLAQGTNGIEAVELIRTHKPDLVFLDVQMPGLDGFGVLKKLLDRKVPMPQVVFATAFNQYAVRAFEVNAVDYLLKPFDRKRVMQTIEKAQARLSAPVRVCERGEAGCAAAAGGGAGSAGEGELGQGDRAGAEPAAAGGSARDLFCFDRRGDDQGGDPYGGGPLELQDAGGVDGPAGSGDVLAGAPVVCGEYSAHTRGGAVVQIELPAPDGRCAED